MRRLRFVLEDANAELQCDADGYVAESFKRTMNYWRNWIGHCTYKGRWREMVNRSALTLKMLVAQPFGSLIAAPTFGLPEVHRRRTQLGLSLYLDSRRLVHHLRLPAARLHGGSGGLQCLDRAALP